MRLEIFENLIISEISVKCVTVCEANTILSRAINTETRKNQIKHAPVFAT